MKPISESEGIPLERSAMLSNEEADKIDLAIEKQPLRCIRKRNSEINRRRRAYIYGESEEFPDV